MPVKHGVFVYEDATQYSGNVTTGDGVIVAIGTAPVHMLDDYSGVVNKPVLCNSAAEAKAMLGSVEYTQENFAKYTLLEVMYMMERVNRVAPIVFINVLDPDTHLTEAAIGGDVEPDSTGGTKYTLGSVETTIIKRLRVKLASAASGVYLTRGVDYVVTIEDGHAVINGITGGAGGYTAGATIGVFPDTINTTAVTASTVIGSQNANSGACTGLEVIRHVYPMFGLVPSVLIAPGWSKDNQVAAALSAKAENINGVFRGIAVSDVSTTLATTYTGLRTAKSSAGLSLPNTVLVWPCVKINDFILQGSTLVAATMAYTDSNRDGIPSRSPSNKVVAGSGIQGTVLADGTEVFCDRDQATTVNNAGVVTFLNMNGWRVWGNYTALFPEESDPKDIWINVRRMFNWQANNFILRYFERVDDPMNQVLVESVVDSENIRCAAFAPEHWAGATIQYLKADNPISNILAGKITFRQRIAPYTPAQEIDNILSYDTELLEATLSQM